MEKVLTYYLQKDGNLRYELHIYRWAACGAIFRATVVPEEEEEEEDKILVQLLWDGEGVAAEAAVDLPKGVAALWPPADAEDEYVVLEGATFEQVEEIAAACEAAAAEAVRRIKRVLRMAESSGVWFPEPADSLQYLVAREVEND